MIDWSQYPNFSKHEFDCKHTGKNEMQPEFLKRLQILRTVYGKPIVITSGFRHPSHPVEIKKNNRGVHTYGVAADIAVDRTDAFELLKIAFTLGFTGVGIKQHGDGRFIHLDTMPEHPNFIRPTVWSYR